MPNKKPFSYIVALLFFILVSCRPSGNDKVITIQLSKTDFTEQIEVYGELQAVHSTLISAPAVHPLTILKLVEEGTYLHKGDTVCILESESVFNDYNRTLEELEQVTAQNNKKRADMQLQAELLKAQIKTIEVQAKLSSLDSLQLKYSSPAQRRIKELQLEINQINHNKVMKKLKNQKTINQSEFKNMDIQVMQKKRKIKSAKDKLEMLALIAPNDGYAVYETSIFGGKFKEGDRVFPNMAILAIPDMSQFQVAMKVNERKFKRIKKNMPVKVRVDALAPTVFDGKIKTTAAVAKQSNTKMFGGGGVRIMISSGPSKNNETKIKLFDVIATVEGNHPDIIPEMSTTCNIIINNIQDTIVIPQVAIFENDSSKYVYVQNNNKFKPTPITIGTSNNKEAIVSKGLIGNEIIALSRPGAQMITE